MMKNVPKRATAVIAALDAVALLPLGAHALERVGPNDPTNGFPRWFQDSTGITLDLCVPQTAAEAPWCNMALDPGVTIPEQFPENWSVEHFYWMGETSIVNANLDAGLIMGVESTFSTDAADPGAQITFARIRWDLRDRPAGTCRVYTPYIVKEFTHTDGGARFRYVEDLGANCAVGSFDCTVTDGNIDLFLLPSADGNPGGPERPWDTSFLGPTGRRYIANPTVPVAVTGIRLEPFTDVEGNLHDPNTFLIERISGTPAVLGFTTSFTIMGRLFEGTIVADAKVDRASYASDGAGNQVDVYASGFPARPARTPGDTIVTNPTFPTIGFYSAPCEGEAPGFSAPAGLNAVPLARTGSVY